MKKSFGVIFDMDGVIVDSNPAHKKAIRQFCERYGKEVTDSFLKNRVFGKKNSDWLPELFGSMSDERLQKLSQEKEHIFREMFDPWSHRVAGLVDFVEELSEREVPMAVATSAPADNSSYILKHLLLRKRFRAVLHTSDVVRGKPAPDIYEAAASKLDLAPARCLVFEDSPTGAEAAQKAGCLTVGVATTYRDGELDFCYRVIDDFIEVTYENVENWIQEQGT